MFCPVGRSVTIRSNTCSARHLTTVQVCRFFHDAVDNDPCLQYKIELAAAGLEDGHALVLAERRGRLRKYLNAWQRLEFTSLIPWKAFPPLLLEHGSIQAGGIMGNARGMHMRQFASLLRGIPEQQRWQAFHL